MKRLVKLWIASALGAVLFGVVYIYLQTAHLYGPFTVSQANEICASPLGAFAERINHAAVERCNSVGAINDIRVISAVLFVASLIAFVTLLIIVPIRAGRYGK